MLLIEFLIVINIIHIIYFYKVFNQMYFFITFHFHIIYLVYDQQFKFNFDRFINLISNILFINDISNLLIS